MTTRQPIRWCFAGLLAGLLLIAWSAPSLATEAEDQTCAEESFVQVAAADSVMSSTGETAPPTDAVQERGVPRIGPGGMAPPAERLDIGVALIDHNRITAKPGYVIDIQTDNQAVFKKGGGGGPTVSVSCECAGRVAGGCKLKPDQGGAGAWCAPGGFSKCKGTCILIPGDKKVMQ